MGKKLLGLLALIGLLMISSLLWWRWTTQAVGGGTVKLVVVPKGATIDEIGRKLGEEKLIRSVAAFKLMVMKLGASRQIQAGDFRLNQGMNLTTVVQTLTHGSLDVWVTLPEGWRREQVAQRLKEELGYQFEVAEFLEVTDDKEGYLFPDTYLIPKEASAAAVVNLLTDTFEKKVGEVGRQTVILASMVEREAKGDHDRQIIADILTKRLKLGMGLNVDATLQYILGNQTDWWPIPQAQDKQLKSAFNTYIYAGLPPAPIASPGLAAITAVLQTQDTPYLYYLHDREGSIHVAETLAEHQENIRRYLDW